MKVLGRFSGEVRDIEHIEDLAGECIMILEDWETEAVGQLHLIRYNNAIGCAVCAHKCAKAIKSTIYGD